MPTSPPAADKIFAEALLRTAGEERAAYLKEACGEHAQLLERVERLLRAHNDALSFLETPPSAVMREASPTLDEAPLEKPGTQIGPYKLLQQIGEGGMGVVYMAEQTEPVQRKVALKVIKPGMDSRQVIARFEAERQALALMDHVNIARVLDAGATASPSPNTATTTALRRGSDWSCSCLSARQFSMPTRRGSSIATSSRPT